MFTTQKRTLVTLIALLTLSAAVAGPVPSKGLVLDFRNGANTLKLKDSSPFKNSGKATSVVISNSPSLVSMQNTRQLTLAAWIKPNSIPDEFPVIFSKGAHNTSGTNGGYELTLNANGDNDIVFYSGDFEAYTGGANGSLINQHLGEWIHVAVTVDLLTDWIKIYVNGQPYYNVIPSGSLVDVNFDVANDLYIGTKDPVAAPSMSAFDGRIKQVLIYNRALSPDEVQKIFLTTKPKEVLGERTH